MLSSEKRKLEDKIKYQNYELRLNEKHTMRDNNQLRENIKETANTLKSKESELEKVNKENRALEKKSRRDCNKNGYFTEETER